MSLRIRPRQRLRTNQVHKHGKSCKTMGPFIIYRRWERRGSENRGGGIILVLKGNGGRISRRQQCLKRRLKKLTAN